VGAEVVGWCRKAGAGESVHLARRYDVVADELSPNGGHSVHGIVIVWTQDGAYSFGILSGMSGRSAVTTVRNERRSAAATLDGRALRTFVLDQRIGYRYSAPVTNLRQRLKVVPPRVHGLQQRGRWRFAVRGVPSSSTRTFLDRFGNVTIHVSVPRVDDAVEFVLGVEADTDESRWPCDVVVDRGYLRPTRLTCPEGSVVDLVPGGGRADVASLCERVHRSLDYEWGITGVGTTASEALAGGRGVCQDYAHVMLAVCRAAGIPARYVSGHLGGEGGSHAWVEVLHPHPYRTNRWVAQGWDPTHNRRADSDYLVVAVGRDYADVAPLSGTYEGAGATNTLDVEKHLELR
jgi:transglutaminase-like putative cysteine protease